MSNSFETKILEVIFEEVNNFSGDYADVSYRDAWETSIKDEQPVFEMNDKEKIYLTLSERRGEIAEDLVKKVCGKNFDEIKLSEVKKLDKMFLENASSEDIEKSIQLVEESEALLKLMWGSIYDRAPKLAKGSAFELRPGWNIVVGIKIKSRVENFLENLKRIDDMNGPVGDGEY